MGFGYVIEKSTGTRGVCLLRLAEVVVGAMEVAEVAAVFVAAVIWHHHEKNVCGGGSAKVTPGMPWAIVQLRKSSAVQGSKCRTSRFA